MSGIGVKRPQGELHDLWSGQVNDYAIAGGWMAEGHRLVVGDAAGGLHAMDGQSGAIQWSCPDGHQDGLLALAVHPHSQMLATSGQDGRVFIWDGDEGERRHTLELGRGWAEHIAWSPDGRWLAAAQSRRVHLFDSKGEAVWSSKEHPSTVSAIEWANAKELSTACYGRVSFFDAAQGDETQTLEWKGSLISITFSPDRDVVVCASQDNSVHFWRRSTGDDSMMSGYPRKPSALAFDDSGAFLATGGGEAITVWNFQNGGPEGTRPTLLELHVDGISSLCFAPGTRTLASGSRAGGVVTWGLDSNGEGEPLGAALVHDSVAELLWRPDGAALAALDASGGVTVWRSGP